MTEYTITDYDNSGTWQTLFAPEHISTLSETESSKIRELAKLTDTQAIKNHIDKLVLTNFQQQVGRYLLDVKALKNQQWDTNRKPESDSIYQAVLTIMQHYDGSSPTYDQMIARYLTPTEQAQYLQDRKEVYTQSGVLEHTSQAPTSIPSTPPASWVQTTNPPCSWPNCTPSYNNDNQLLSPQTPIKELTFNSLNDDVKTITDFTQRTKFLQDNTDKNIIVYTSKSDCNNCKTIAWQFPPNSAPDNNTVYVHVDITNLTSRNKTNNATIDWINGLSNNIKQMPIIFALKCDDHTKKRSIPQDKIYSVTWTDQYNNDYQFGNDIQEKIWLTDMITKLTQTTDTSQT
jgi:hypothetical protein